MLKGGQWAVGRVQLDTMQQDALRELAEIAAQAGAAALSEMVGRSVRASVTHYHEVEARGLAAELGLSTSDQVVGSASKLEGDLRGALLIGFTGASAMETARLISPGSSEGLTLTAFDQSVLKECANILSDKYLSAFYSLLGLEVSARVPLFAAARWDALVRYTFLGTAPGAERVWVVESLLDYGVEPKPRAILLLDARGASVVGAAVQKQVGG